MFFELVHQGAGSAAREAGAGCLCSQHAPSRTFPLPRVLALQHSWLVDTDVTPTPAHKIPSSGQQLQLMQVSMKELILLLKDKYL